MGRFGVSQTKACRFFGLSRSTSYYKAKKSPEDEKIIQRMKELVEKKRSWGMPTIHSRLRLEGIKINHKRTYRLYRLAGLSLKVRKRKKRASTRRLELPQAARPNERWAMDFVHDTLGNGMKFRMLGIIDTFTKECLHIETDSSINGKRVTRCLDWLVLTRGKPKAITVDNGPEFAGKALDKWAYEHDVLLDFIRPGKPVENAFIESFNGRFRQECLNQHYFKSVLEARFEIQNWRRDYNEFRPHSSLKGLTPSQFSTNFNNKNLKELYSKPVQRLG